MTVQRWNPFPSEPDSIEVVDANDYDALAARLAEVTSERDNLRTMLLNERNERATDSAGDKQ